MSTSSTQTVVRRRTRVLGGLAATFVACLVVAVGPAVVGQEQPDTSPLSVRKIDATDPEAVGVDVIWTGDREAITTATVRENGQERKLTADPVPLSTAGVKTAMVVVVDTSRSMASNGGVRKTQETLETMIGSLEEGEEMGIVGFGTTVEVYSEITADKGALQEAAAEIVAPDTGKTAMWDGLRKASSLFEDVPDLQANIVLITDGFDDSSVIDANEAASDVARAGGAVFALSYGAENQDDSGALTALVERVGGAVIPAPTEEDLGAGLTRVQQSLDQQFRLTFASSGEQGAADLEISIGGESVETTYVSGAVAEGAANLAPPIKSKSIIPSFVRGTAGLIVVVAVGGFAVALAVVALATIASKEETSLDRMLQTYTEPGMETGADDDSLAQTAFVQRAVELTGELAAKQGALVKVEKMLERADLPLRAAEAIFFYLAAGLVVTIAVTALLGILGVLIGGLLGFLLPIAVLNFLGARRQKQFNTALPDMLQLLSGSLRAGYSLVQGVDAVAQEVDGPMGKELRRVMTEARLGRELEDALEASAERVQSKDFEWAIMAIRIQREVGGNLSELLLTVADTMVERERLRRDVSTLTAEGKMSAIILGGMPVALGGAMYVMNPDYMGVLFTDTLGKVLLGVGTLAALIGFAWMKKCITIEI